MKFLRIHTDAQQRPSLLRMTWPVFIEYAMAMLVGNIDQIMISNYSTDAVAAIGNANQVLNLLILTFTVISLSTTILVSQYIGANRREEIGTIYSLAVAVNSIFGVLISAVLIIFPLPIARFMQIDMSLYDDFRKYLAIVGGAIFLQAIFTTLTSIFKSNAMMKQCMFISVVVNVVNIICNALLIYGVGPFPELGVAGAAIATNMGRLAGVALLIILYVKQIGVPIGLKQLKPFPKNIMKKMMFIGVPSGGESISYNITTIVIMRMINDFSLVDVKAKFYAGMFAMLSWMFASAVSQASQILVGYAIGARDYPEAQSQVRRTLLMSVVTSLAMASLLYLFSGGLFSLMTDSAEIIALGRKIMLIDIVLEVGRAVNITMVRSLQAAGDIKFPITLGIISTWLVAVGLSYVLGVRNGMCLRGVWIAMACDECLRAVIFLIRWKSGKWKTKNLIGEKVQSEKN